MKTWEAYQTNRPVGRTRQKLADMIEKSLPGVVLYPEDLLQQNPAYSRAEVDACAWDAWGKRGSANIHFYSWSSMGVIVSSGGVVATEDGGPSCYEIDPR